MSTGADREIQGWMEDWKADEAATSADLRGRILRRVKRQSLFQRLYAVVEVVMGLAITLMLVRVAARASHPSDLPVMILLLALVAGAFAWGFRLRSGLWRPRGESAADFLDLSLRRVRQRLRLVKAGYVILAIEIAIFIPWILIRSDSPAPFFGFLGGMVAAALAIMIAVGRWTKRDLESLLDLKRSLDGNDQSVARKETSLT